MSTAEICQSVAGRVADQKVDRAKIANGPLQFGSLRRSDGNRLKCLLSTDITTQKLQYLGRTCIDVEHENGASIGQSTQVAKRSALPHVDTLSPKLPLQFGRPARLPFHDDDVWQQCLHDFPS